MLPPRTPRHALFAPSLALALLLVVFAAPREAHAQSTPVAQMENATGDSVFVSFEDGSFAAFGEEGVGTIPAEGEGVRLMWYPAKAAFRAGKANTSDWDEANVGDYSVAFGRGTVASAEASTAMGQFTTASGAEGSTAMGSHTTASGPVATAMGVQATASGFASTAMGEDTEASGDWATAMGFVTRARTPKSLSIGEYNSANISNDSTLFVAGNGDIGSRSNALVLDFAGNLTIAGTLSQNSDRRLKENIEPLGAGTLEKLGKVQPVRFRFRDERTHPSGKQIGLIAQEVRRQFPELVSTGSGGYLSVSYSKFTAVLLKGLQEQQAQIMTQNEKIGALRAKARRVDALEARMAALEKERGGGALAALDGPWTLGGGLLGALLLGGLLWRRRSGRPGREGRRAASLLLFLIAGLLLVPSVAAQTVAIQNGGLLTLDAGGTLDLGSATTLVEEESSGARLTGGSGTVTATRTLNAPASENMAGLGAVITSGANLGETTVTRAHLPQTDNGNSSIERFYDLEPATGSGLDATLALHYHDAELNGLPESALTLFRSDDGGTTYRLAGHDSRDPSTNTVTLSGIDSLSRWTVGSEDQPLPVELASFEATPSDAEEVRLTWQTATETGNARFEVERRTVETFHETSLRTWKTVATAQSKAPGGSSSEALSYTVTDAGLPFEAEALEYRLVQVDLDGDRTVAERRTVEIGGPTAFTLHGSVPNPMQGRTTIRYELPEARAVTVAVYDALGRKIRTLVDEEQEGRQEVALKADGLSSGIYFYRITAGDYSETRKLVLVR